MTSLTELADAMQELLSTGADEAAAQTGFVRRKRKITGPNFAQAVVFTALADSEAPRSRFQVFAAATGLTASRQAIEKRFDARGAEFLRGLLRRAVEKVVATPVLIRLLQRFTGVEVLDSSVIALPDELAGTYRGGHSGRAKAAVAKASVKLTVGLELRTGALRGPELSDGRTGDLKAPLAQTAPPEGGLQIADLNYFCLKKFADWQGIGAYWLSRLKSGTKVHDEHGRRVDLVARLRAAGAADVDLDIRLGSQHRLPCRLIARRVPAEVADLRRRRLLDKCADRGNRPSATSLALCEWAVLVTDVPRELLSVTEAIALARMRWQIELIFKLWKSRGGVATFRGTRPQAVLCEVYGKLLAQVVGHWMIVVGAWARRERSLTKAAEIVRTLAMSLATAMRSLTALRGVLSHARQLMDLAARMDKRRKSPNAHDLIFCIESEA
ncbi:MAG: IS4 family transposase [Isosphaeraceae bacterium]